jgi:hypothetical protein
MTTYRVDSIKKMKPTKIDVLMDTNIILDGTADSLRIVMTDERDIVGDYDANGKIIRGTGLVEISSSNTTVMGLKEDLVKIEAKKVGLQAELENLEQQRIATEKLIFDATPIIDQAIAEAIENGAEDRRKPQ